MKPLNVVVAHRNSSNAEFLAQSLNHHFRVVKVARDLEDLRRAIPQHRAEVAIVDLELAGIGDVRDLTHDFSGTIVVCTHRLADEKMWTEALAAGAADCCHSSDVRAIVMAENQTRPVSHSHAA